MLHRGLGLVWKRGLNMDLKEVTSVFCFWKVKYKSNLGNACRMEICRYLASQKSVSSTKFYTASSFKPDCSPHRLQDSACTYFLITSSLWAQSLGLMITVTWRHSLGIDVCRIHCTLATLITSSSHNLFNMFTF